MFKKFVMGIAGVLALSVLFVGCGKKASPEDLAKDAQKQVNEAQYMDANIEMNIGVTVGGQTQEVKATGNIKEDNSGEIPISDSVVNVENLGTFERYTNSQSKYLIVAGQAIEEKYTDEMIDEIKKEANTNVTDANKSVEQNKKDGKQELKVTIDNDKSQKYFESTFYYPIAIMGIEQVGEMNMSVKELVEYYVLDKNNKVVEMRVEIIVDIMGIPLNIKMNINFDSLNEKLEIQTPSDVEAKTETTTKAAA